MKSNWMKRIRSGLRANETFKLMSFVFRAMAVDNLFTSTKENERLQKVYQQDRNKPFFLEVVTLLAADDNAHSALVLFTYLHCYRRKKEQLVLQRQFVQMTCLLSARYKLHASSILWQMKFKELLFLEHNIVLKFDSRKTDTK